jgi:predicted amidohydrolase
MTEDRSSLVVAAAQSFSVRGDVDRNLSEHLRLVDAAASAGARLVVFPELSLTGYELDLASELQLRADDPRLEPLRAAAARHGVHVLAGGPWRSGQDRPYLGAFLLSPGPTRCYAKVHVHESEAEYFTAGKEGCTVSIGGTPIGFAICADTNHPSHAADAASSGAELYVASVMKTPAKYPAHAGMLQRYAARHRMAVMTANYAGSTGGSESAGKSAFWNEHGELVAQAPSNAAALVVARREGDRWQGEVVPDP